jgi:hypothetical protein
LVREKAKYFQYEDDGMFEDWLIMLSILLCLSRLQKEHCQIIYGKNKKVSFANIDKNMYEPL